MIFQVDLGRDRFLAWSAWVCVFTSIFVFLLAISNACLYINRFTRFAGEAFGALIALLFMQQAIKGTVDEFRMETIGDSYLKVVNGLWSLFLGFGMVLTALLIRTARKWRFLFSPLRSLLADYGVPVLVVIWTGLSYAVSYPEVPSRVSTPNTWDVKATWKISTVGGAVLPFLFFSSSKPFSSVLRFC